jgi:MoxR-like ATPase
MNEDASTFELPEYIQSRLTPTILVDFPDEDEELEILANNLPFAPEELLRWVSRFLKRAHEADEGYTVRDGVNIARYAMKRASLAGESAGAGRLAQSVRAVLGDEALRYAVEDGATLPPPGPRRT